MQKNNSQGPPDLDELTKGSFDGKDLLSVEDALLNSSESVPLLKRKSSYRDLKGDI